MSRAQCEKTQENAAEDEETDQEAPCNMSSVWPLSIGQPCAQASRTFH
jgi:hypothetical protein